MKKLKFGRNNSRSSKVKIHRLGLHKVIAIPLILLVAIGGIVTLKFSLAESNVYGVQIVMHDPALRKNIPGIRIELMNYIPGEPLCAVITAATDNAGSAIFGGCPPSNSYTATMYPENYGYEARITDLGGNVKKITSTTVISGNATQGNYSSYVINIFPIDTDSDGVPNNTAGYPVDNCPNVAGSNGGCPPAPATPAQANPTTPAKPAPKPAAKPSTPSTKKPTASTAPTPAVVVATSGDTTPPSAIENLIISQAEGSVFLTWDDASDNVGVTGYNIERSNDSENWSSIADNISDSFYTDSDTGSDKEYYYKIQAIDAGGNLSEGTIDYIELDSKSAKSTAKSKSASPAAKKTSAGLVAGLSIGVLMVLAAIVAAFVLMRRRIQGSNSMYGYDVSDIGVDAPQAVVSPNDPPAEHTSTSLKDMVMQDLEHKRHDDKQ